MHHRELGCSSADILFFQSLRLPADMFLPTRNENAFSATLIGQMRRFAASICPSPTRVEPSKKIYMPPELKTCSHIFVKQDPIKPNLTPPNSGPYLVISRTDKTFRVLNNDQIMSVAIINVKPCFQLNNAEDVSAETPIFCESASASPCGVCQSRRNNNNNRNPGDPAIERFSINISVVLVAYITFVVYI